MLFGNFDSQLHGIYKNNDVISVIGEITGMRKKLVGYKETANFPFALFHWSGRVGALEEEVSSETGNLKLKMG